MADQLDRIERMLAALCDHLGAERAGASDDAAPDLGAEAGRRYAGTVSAFEHGWGFIECGELKRNVFVHHRDVEGTGPQSLTAGEDVSFEVGPGKGGRPKALRVRRQATDQAAGGHRIETQDEDDAEESFAQVQPPSPEMPRQLSSYRQGTANRPARRASPRTRPAISW